MDLKSLLKFPLVFFILAAGIGLLLRAHHFWPIDGFTYPYWLHGHSHGMFLGWIVNALTIGFVARFLDEHQHPRYVRLLLLVNGVLALMLISFPLQGYGLCSIILSTLHTALVCVFIYWFYRDTRYRKGQVAVDFARLSLVFFFISAAGPLVLGVLMAKGLGYTQEYYLAVYYYLHFQYNGVFTFGALALFYQWLETSGMPIEQSSAKRFLLWLFIACFPAYALSTLWTNPGTVIVLIGGISAGMQIIAFLYFIRSFRKNISTWLRVCKTSSQILLYVAFLAFGVKLILQLLSAHPTISLMAYEVRNYVMAYLHLVLLGMISFFLMAWYQEQFKKTDYHPILLILLIGGFLLSEIMLIGTGWMPRDIINGSLLVASIGMLLGIAGLSLMFIHIETKS
ncbi:MAG: hypothetical protein MUE95_02025 [Cyclobacteriaceae bacterium]|nr:hypothetical protein [Cyclobacteriaceae bacterium]